MNPADDQFPPTRLPKDLDAKPRQTHRPLAVSAASQSGRNWHDAAVAPERPRQPQTNPDPQDVRQEEDQSRRWRIEVRGAHASARRAADRTTTRPRHHWCDQDPEEVPGILPNALGTIGPMGTRQDPRLQQHPLGLGQHSRRRHGQFGIVVRNDLQKPTAGPIAPIHNGAPITASSKGRCIGHHQSALDPFPPWHGRQRDSMIGRTSAQSAPTASALPLQEATTKQAVSKGQRAVRMQSR